jgi:hypothetical protein
MTEMVTSGSMSGEGNRSDGLLGESDYERRRSLQAPPALHATALFLDSTQPFLKGGVRLRRSVARHGSPNRRMRRERTAAETTAGPWHPWLPEPIVIGCLTSDPSVQTPAKRALGFGVARVFGQYGQKAHDPAPVPQQAMTYRDVIVKHDGNRLFKERHFE